MRDLIRMVVVLTALTFVAGGLLAAVKSATELQIENQVLKFQKAPAINSLFPDATNDPVTDRFTVEADDMKLQVFQAKNPDGTNLIAFETKGSGFGGTMGLMVGVNVQTDAVEGVRMTTHAETPGIGTKAKDDLSFVSQFNGLNLNEGFALQAEGGSISAISGATVTSKGLLVAANKAKDIYKKLKPKIIENLK
jgi:Na+-translocating ferredoxin:NAD+ oxidoreductase subunit G